LVERPDKQELLGARAVAETPDEKPEESATGVI
jgi:hypothetical protein